MTTNYQPTPQPQPSHEVPYTEEVIGELRRIIDRIEVARKEQHGVIAQSHAATRHAQTLLDSYDNYEQQVRQLIDKAESNRAPAPPSSDQPPVSTTPTEFQNGA
ncbi:hypothetical protein ACIBH1_45475 [Nonomuraea sp. NPDC050663]|uniref:hypothetical protein n=1 Tax=Nonomuraea sp. NPDC050663 TaxID=3364370 RepID=UPI0037980FB2